MGILKLLSIVLTGFCVDAFVFPLFLASNTEINSKMVMAVMGVAVLMRDLYVRDTSFFNRRFLFLSILAVCVSLIGVISTTLNATHDYTYATYIVSMWVWLFAAYFVMTVMRHVHGHVSVQLLASYLAAVGIFQCCFTLLYEYAPAFTEYIDNARWGIMVVFETRGRLQGFSAALDPAGIRFAAMLVVIGYACVKCGSLPHADCLRVYYIFSFFLISVVGSMVARTAGVGAVVAVMYLAALSVKSLSGRASASESGSLKRIWILALPMLIVFVAYTSYKYNSNDHFRENLRFGFEGFFSLVEKGRWEVSSNEILKNMVVWPESLKTWLIGDGYIENPAGDPYYTGEIIKGYYMGTDIGYLRFIFYFGVIGLASYMAFFFYAARTASDCFPSQKALFMLLLTLNLIIWFKVSTDIFQFFALFIAAGSRDGRKAETGEPSFVILEE